MSRITIVNSDVAVGQWGSGLERRGLGHCWGAGVQPGSRCHHYVGPGGGSEAGGGALVVVDNIVGFVDGGCGAIARGGVAMLGGL